MHSTLVHFAVGVALFSAGVLQLMFAATGPPPNGTSLPGSGAQIKSESDKITDPLLAKGNATISAKDGSDVSQKTGSYYSHPDTAQVPIEGTAREGQPDMGATADLEGGSVVVQTTSWPPAWARSM